MPEELPAIVVAGDALVDLTSCRTAAGTVVYEPHAGGSCLNIAAGLGRLGVPTALLARISRDGFGRFLRAHLTESGVGGGYLIPTDDLTCLAVADIDGGEAGWAFHAAEAADRGLTTADLAGLPDAGALPAGAALHVGSIALVQEPQASALDALIHRESGHRPISIDPNIRPGLIADADAYRDRLTRCIGRSDLVKLSNEDLDWLHPGRPHPDVAQEWIADGVGLVVVTLGGTGAWAATCSAVVQCLAPQVSVQDTVGAGDAFMAMVLAQLHRRGLLSRAGIRSLDRDTLEEVLAAAVWAGADTCTRAGAQPPWLADVPGGLLVR
jgi:fructokinase